MPTTSSTIMNESSNTGLSALIPYLTVNTSILDYSMRLFPLRF